MAVVSQPFDRGTVCSAPGTPDSELNEFWEEDPWEIAFRHNLSCYERNRTYLNLGGRRFADISSLSGADSDGDGRSVVAADFRCNGQMDLLVRQAGGGALLYFENHFPKANYLKVSLRGSKNNRLGIGARVTAIVDGRSIVRELYPANTFHSQATSSVHIGLGKAERINKLSVRWPDGLVQDWSDVEVNRHVILDEASGTIEPVTPGATIKP